MPGRAPAGEHDGGDPGRGRASRPPPASGRQPRGPSPAARRQRPPRGRRDRAGVPPPGRPQRGRRRHVPAGRSSGRAASAAATWRRRRARPRERSATGGDAGPGAVEQVGVLEKQHVGVEDGRLALAREDGRVVAGAAHVLLRVGKRRPEPSVLRGGIADECRRPRSRLGRLDGIQAGPTATPGEAASGPSGDERLHRPGRSAVAAQPAGIEVAEPAPRRGSSRRSTAVRASGPLATTSTRWPCSAPRAATRERLPAGTGSPPRVRFRIRMSASSPRTARTRTPPVGRAARAAT